MELRINFLKQILSNTRPKIDEHMLIVIATTPHEEQSSQPL